MAANFIVKEHVFIFFNFKEVRHYFQKLHQKLLTLNQHIAAGRKDACSTRGLQVRLSITKTNVLSLILRSIFL